MSNSFKADDHVKATGAYGGGNYRAYDEKTGKSGYVNSSGYFIPDEPKKSFFSKDTTAESNENYSQPTYNTPPSYSASPMPSSDSSIVDSVGTAAVVGASIVAGVAAASYISARAKNPDDPSAAVKKAAKNGGCTAGILGIILIMVVSAAFWGIYKIAEQPTGHISDIIIAIIEIICILSIIGLLRVMLGKSFFIVFKAHDVNRIAESIANTQRTVIPKGVNIAIVIIATVALYLPSFRFLNGLTEGWVDNNLSFALITVLVILMIIMSAMVGTLVGLAIVGILKLVTNKE